MCLASAGLAGRTLGGRAIPMSKTKPAAPPPPDATPALPHERDEGGDQVSPAPDPVIEQAAQDLADGQVDTDLRATPGLDAPRRRRLLRRDAPR